MQDSARYKEVIRELLATRGKVVSLDGEAYFSAEMFDGIEWTPTYAFEVAESEVWAVELVRGSWGLDGLLREMAETRSRDNRVRLAVFMPEAEEGEWEGVVAACGEKQVEVIGYVGGRYRFIAARGLELPDKFLDSPCRIPPPLVAQLEKLGLCEGVAKALMSFAEKHQAALRMGEMTDGHEQELLLGVARGVTESDERFVGALPLLELLWAVERVTSSGRDHFFHTFHDLFLGFIVIGHRRERFLENSVVCFPGGEEVVPEYVWFLTALFHDLGYSVSQRHEVIYGVDRLGDPVTAELEQIWDTPDYELQRDQLVSLMEHLRSEEIRESWSPTPFGLRETSAFGIALRSGFLREGGHSVASAIRLLTEFRKEARGMDPAVHGFLARHVYLAALSMIFHDWRVREEIIEAGFTKLRSSRFPYAALLMFIDSIQDDRREKASPGRRMDVLERLTVEGDVVKAVLNLQRIGVDTERHEVGEYLVGKRVEWQSVVEFIEGDGLAFEYPS